MYNDVMKIWILDTKTPTHRIVRLNALEHSNHKYIGDLDDDALGELLISIQSDIDLEKNMKLFKYYGYLHLFVVSKD